MTRPSLPTLLALAAIVVLGVLLRSHDISAPYFADFHAYRQGDSAAFVHGYLVDSFNPLDPSVDRHPCRLKQHRFGRVEAELPVAAWVAAGTALYVVKRDPALTAEDLQKFCAEQLTGYKKPKYIRFIDDLPKTNVGKILRRELRQQALASPPG